MPRRAGGLPAHIFTADKGDYYNLDDGLPAYPGWPAADPVRPS